MPRPSNLEIRTRILLKGAEVVRRDGFNATAVQDIASAADVPKGSFYNYFETKDAFAVEVLDVYRAQAGKRYVLLQDASVTPRARLDRYFGAVVAFHGECGYAFGCLASNMAIELTTTSEPVRAKLREVFDGWAEIVAECLREGQAAGEIRTDRDAEEMAHTLIEAFAGAVMIAKVERSASCFERFLKFTLPGVLGEA